MAIQEDLTCRACNALLLGDEPLGGHCLACLLDAAQDDDLTGSVDRFDHYKLDTDPEGIRVELGRGAMGVTYRAIDTVLGHAVALKVIDSHLAADPQAQERFLREARAAARLRHPNIASVFYYGARQTDGQCFYAMELVEGETLETRLSRTGPLPMELALEVVAQIARALTVAQSQGLVHRDLKPANLMLTNQPELTVKVIDFGVAKALTNSLEASLTLTGFVGTPAFASPEQLAGADVDGRSDLYSLGVTLWQMLTGRLPFMGSKAELIQQHLSASLPLDQLKAFPKSVVALLRTLLEKDPGKRFQNPIELLKELTRLTKRRGRRERVGDLNPDQILDADSGPEIGPPPANQGSRKISVAHLPVTGSHVFGREEDIAFLDTAWESSQVNIVTIVAWAGVGKSTLVNHWLRRIAMEEYRRAEIVYGWSFYTQGDSGASPSADQFIDAALRWFGDPDPRLGTEWEKGQRLAKLVADRRSLLILDGLEPFQNPPGPREGRVREASLQALLRELAAFNQGLCIVTTRSPVADLADHEGTSVLRRDLEHLGSKAGAELLRTLGVKGRAEELQKASDEFGGHCLALTLLGSYLTDAYHGDIHCRREVSTRLVDDPRQGIHAQKVLQSYQAWFGEGPEVSVLLMLGLFDRPAEEKAFEALLKPPVIAGLTDLLCDPSPAAWRTVLARLRRAKLLAQEDLHRPGSLDTHPLVRVYFGEQLRNLRPKAWAEGHRRLYDYHRRLSPQLPNSLTEMEPLFSAVVCGCHAGLYRDALHEVYIPRIQRGADCFAANVLGARGPLLSVLSHFFEPGRWGSMRETTGKEQSLTAEDQLFILMQAGLYLTATRGLGETDALRCYERAELVCSLLDRPALLHVALVGQWRYSLNTGPLNATIQIARRVYSMARKQRDAALMVGAYRALAATLYFLGDFKFSRRYAMRALQIWRSDSKPSPGEESITPAVSCLCYQGLSEWHFGKLALCRAAMAEAISLARELNDQHALAQALWFAGFVGQFEQSPAEVESAASELIEISTRQSFAAWLSRGAVLHGWALSASGTPVEGLSWVEEGLQDYRATTSVLDMPYLLALKAESLHFAGHPSAALEAISEAETFVERYQQRWWSAELHRLSGVFLAAIDGDQGRIKATFSKAMSIAKDQGSISLRLRAEASDAEFRRQEASAWRE
jgi:serine/threonine protein kinase/predicted ATPase